MPSKLISFDQAAINAIKVAYGIADDDGAMQKLGELATIEGLKAKAMAAGVWGDIDFVLREMLQDHSKIAKVKRAVKNNDK